MARSSPGNDVANGYTNGHGNGKKPGITVFSGGTAANSLVDVFKRIAKRKRAQLTYVIPISDNGGSSSELIRFIGGPSVGDIRSRLVRLMPTREGDGHEDDPELSALRKFFEHRLSSDKTQAKDEWRDIVESTHPIWKSISSPKKELIRSILNTLNLEIVKRTRPPESTFNFTRASIGNLFLTGARIFSGSLESAIYLLSVICSIPRSVSVLPAINSNFTHHISASLTNGTIITGQANISHPLKFSSQPDADSTDEFEDANLPGAHPELRRPNIAFDKNEEEELPARISRVWYINPYGEEITPQVNPKVIGALESSSAVIFSIGSLFTSIVPNLVLRGVGKAILNPNIRHKILLLNSKQDRETGPSTDPMSARDFVAAIAEACGPKPIKPNSQMVIQPTGPHLKIAEETFHKYVSHLIYLEGEGVPEVNTEELEEVGIKCVKVDGVLFQDGKTFMMRYDEVALGKALTEIMDS
ncbi:hypothetical protein OQA88_6466 [Cercophora sp. LCS_1]